MPKISVIMPAFNSANTIVESIDSVLKQSFSDFELIVVDDGSTDDTYDRVLGVSLDDCRIRLLQRSNGGVSAARNSALSVASGEYIAFLDSDDVYEMNRFESQLGVVEQDDSIGLIFSRHRVEDLVLGEVSDSNYTFPSSRLTRMEMVWFLLRCGYFFTLDACLVRGSAVEGVRFNETLSTGEDFDFLLQLAKNVNFECTNDYIVTVRRGHQSLTVRKCAEVYANEKRLVDKFVECCGFGLLSKAKIRSYQHLRFSKRFQGRHFNIALLHGILSMLYNPCNVYSYKHFIGELLGLKG